MNRIDWVEKALAFIDVYTSVPLAIEPSYLDRVIFGSGLGLSNLKLGTETSDSEKLRKIQSYDQVSTINQADKVHTLGYPIPYLLEDIKEKGVLRLKFSGPMMAQGDMCFYGMDEVADTLHAAYNHKNITGIIYEPYSGGGEELAGYTLMESIAARNKPVITLTNYSASASVLGTIKSDGVIAYGPMSQIGSIGAYVMLDKKRAAEMKERLVLLVAESSPDKVADFRQFVFEGSTEKYQAMANLSGAAFKQTVIDSVPELKANAVKAQEVTTGKMYRASELLSYGLVKGTGGMKEALTQIQLLR